MEWPCSVMLCPDVGKSRTSWWSSMFYMDELSSSEFPEKAFGNPRYNLLGIGCNIESHTRFMLGGVYF